jgi:hypothetical protein
MRKLSWKGHFLCFENYFSWVLVLTVKYAKICKYLLENLNSRGYVKCMWRNSNLWQSVTPFWFDEKSSNCKKDNGLRICKFVLCNYWIVFTDLFVILVIGNVGLAKIIRRILRIRSRFVRWSILGYFNVGSLKKKQNLRLVSHHRGSHFIW